MAKATKHLKKHAFKPGQSGNPSGRPVMTPEQKALRTLTLEIYRDVINAALTGNLEDLKAIAQDPESSAIKVGVATSLMKAIQRGDPSVLELFASRIVGKIPDVIDLGGVVKITHKVDPVSLRAAMKKVEEDV